MTKRCFHWALCIAIIIMCDCIPCRSQEFSEIVAFGASLTDGGNVFFRSPEFFPFAIPPSPPYYNGRFSNGPNYVDDLAELLDVPPLLPSERGGTNYAWSGATSGLNVLLPLIELVEGQVDDQVSKFLAEHSPQPDQLFVFGAINDLDPRAMPIVTPVQSAGTCEIRLRS